MKLFRSVSAHKQVPSSSIVHNDRLDTMNRGAVLVLIVYFIATCIPGLLGLESSSNEFNVFQIVCFSVLFIYAVYRFIKWRVDTITFPATESRFILAYIGLLAITGLHATFLAIQDHNSLASMAQFYLPAMLAATLIIGFGQTALDYLEINRVLRIILVLIVFSSLYSIVTNFEAIISIESLTSSYGADIRGFFYNRNVFSYMMATGIVIAMYLWSDQRRWWYLLSILILGVSLFTAMSRGGIVFVLIFLLVFLLGRAKSKVITLVAMACVCIPLTFFAVKQPFIESNIIRSDNGDTGRGDLRQYGVDYYLHHDILLGDGQRAITSIEKEYGHSSFHNLYIESLATQGFLGLLVILLGVGYSYSRIRIVKRYYRNLGFFFQAYLVAYVLYILIEALPLFYATPNSLITTYILILLPAFVANKLAGDAMKTNKEAIV